MQAILHVISLLPEINFESAKLRQEIEERHKQNHACQKWPESSSATAGTAKIDLLHRKSLPHTTRFLNEFHCRFTCKTSEKPISIFYQSKQQVNYCSNDLFTHQPCVIDISSRPESRRPSPKWYILLLVVSLGSRGGRSGPVDSATAVRPSNEGRNPSLRKCPRSKLLDTSEQTWSSAHPFAVAK